MKTKLILCSITISLLTACAGSNDVEPAENSKSSSSVGSVPGATVGGIGSPGVGAIGGPTVGGIGNVGVTSGSSPVAQQIKVNYDLYLPHCYTAQRAQYWEAYFARGGTLENFIATLKIVASATTCSSDGQETTTDPHYIKGFYDFYLPGCYGADKQAFWQQWFANGGTDNDFRTTLMQVRYGSPRPACLTN